MLSAPRRGPGDRHILILTPILIYIPINILILILILSCVCPSKTGICFLLLVEFPGTDAPGPARFRPASAYLVIALPVPVQRLPDDLKADLRRTPKIGGELSLKGIMEDRLEDPSRSLQIRAHISV